MPITPSQFQEMQRRVPHKNRVPPVVSAVDIEADLHAEIMKFCDSQTPPWPYIHSRMDKKTRNKKGVADFLVLAPRGRLLIVECKARDEDLSPAQELWRKAAERNGHMVYVIRTMAAFLEVAQMGMGDWTKAITGKMPDL